MDKKELSKNIQEAVEYFKNDGDGCCTFKLDNILAVCVGWSDGYDVTDTSVIHSIGQPTFCINAGIKVWTSDSMRTDYDYINSPYFENGDVWDTNYSISPNENYEKLAEWLLKEYKELSKFEIEDNGKIVRHKNLWICEHCLYALESHEGNQLTVKHYVDENNENESKCEWCEDIGFNTLYEIL